MEKLKFINSRLSAAGIPYEFGQWTSAVVYPYFVGEISESPMATEDGQEQSTMILTGFHRGKFQDLLTVMEQIKSLFNPVHGLRGQTESGSAIVAFFDGYFIVPSTDASLKKIQINLKIYEWKGAI